MTDDLKPYTSFNPYGSNELFSLFTTAPPVWRPASSSGSAGPHATAAIHLPLLLPLLSGTAAAAHPRCRRYRYFLYFPSPPSADAAVVVASTTVPGRRRRSRRRGRRRARDARCPRFSPWFRDTRRRPTAHIHKPYIRFEKPFDSLRLPPTPSDSSVRLSVCLSVLNPLVPTYGGGTPTHRLS